MKKTYLFSRNVIVWLFFLVGYLRIRSKCTVGARGFSSAVSAFGQVLKSEWLRRSCLRSLAEHVSAGGRRNEAPRRTRKKKPLVPRVVKMTANRNFVGTNGNLDRTLSVDRLLFWALKPTLRLMYLSPFTETDPHMSHKHKHNELSKRQH